MSIDPQSGIDPCWLRRNGAADDTKGTEKLAGGKPIEVVFI